MFVRNSSGELVSINEDKTLNEKHLYNMIWSIKFNKITTTSNTISVDQMKKYLNSKCFSL